MQILEANMVLPVQAILHIVFGHLVGQSRENSLNAWTYVYADFAKVTFLKNTWAT